MTRPDDARALPAQVRDLCLLRGGPQDLPWSPGLLVALLKGDEVRSILSDLVHRALAGG